MKKFKYLFISLLLLFLSANAQWSPQWESIDLQTSNNLYDVYFVNDTTGWIVGDLITLKTNDGGATWNNQPIVTGSRYYGVYFKDELNGWRIGKSTTGNAGRVQYTTDGGQTWLVYFTGGSKPWHGIDFADDLNGNIVGQEGGILKTSDGGQTWNPQFNPNGDLGISTEIKFINNDIGFFVGWSSPNVGYIVKTMDSGASWTVVDSNISGGLYGLYFIDEFVGFAVGSNGLILKTIDSGNTWIPKPSGVTTRLEDVYFRDQNNGFAVGFSGTLLVTNDGGETWINNTSANTNSIRGVHGGQNSSTYAVGSFGAILKYCGLSCENLEVYNQYNNNNNEIQLEINNLSIAADGTDSTIFRYYGSNLNDISFKILDDQNQENSDSVLWGSFNTGQVVNDYYEIKYNHPEYFDIPGQQHKNASVQIVNNTTNEPIAQYPIKIVRPSLLLVHGIWSNGDNAFGVFENNLIQNNLYKPNQIHKVEYISDQFNFESVKQYVIDKNYLIKSKTRFENISIGKIDVICHSNGGLLSRYYIQSQQYQDDINKLITFNTPHYGSQFADLLLDSDNFPSDITTFLGQIGKSTTNGVIDDLRVEGQFVSDLQNIGLSNTSNVALHTLSSTQQLDGVGGFLENKWYAFIVRILTRHYFQTDSPDIFLNDLFNNDTSDLIVPSQSQIGGITQTSNTLNENHIGATENDVMQSEAINLLDQNPNDIIHFSNNGFQPPSPSLIYDFSSGSSLMSSNEISNETLTISNPIEGTAYNAGEMVVVDVNGSNGIVNVISTMGNENIPLINQESENNSTPSFNFTIPENAFGRLEIVSVGFDANGYADYDSTYIMVGTNAVLQEIEVSQETIYVVEGQKSIFRVYGIYDDGVKRNITSVDDLNYVFANNNAAVTENGFVDGLQEGDDILTITYLNKTVDVPIIILNSSEWIDITLSNPEVSSGKFDLVIYPNPTQNQLFFSWSDNMISDQLELSIYDMSGKLVFSQTYTQKPSQLDVNQLNSGIYLLKIKSNDQILTRRIIKK